MKLAPRFLIVALLISVGSSAAFAQDTYKAKLHEYLEAVGAMKTFKVAIKGMVESFSKVKTDIPKEIWDELQNEFMGTSLNDLVDFLAPVYKLHLTESDLDELIKFYKSPVGMKIAEKTPLLTQQSMQAGQEWGQKLGQRVADRLKEKGYN